MKNVIIFILFLFMSGKNCEGPASPWDSGCSCRAPRCTPASSSRAPASCGSTASPRSPSSGPMPNPCPLETQTPPHLPPPSFPPPPATSTVTVTHTHPINRPLTENSRRPATPRTQPESQCPSTNFSRSPSKGPGTFQDGFFSG